MSQKQNVITVSEFVNSLKLLIDSYPSFKNVAIIGELSNFTAHHSGHFYFTLKDDKSRISCVMFRSRANSVLFKPKNGDKVIVVGNAEVFESAGTVQIYASRMNLDGLGDLYIQYEALKKKYFDLGYFKEEHKKPFNSYPRAIGVIVGDNSAAYHDISRTLEERWPLAKRVDLLAYVQGDNAVSSLVARIREANELELDAIILGRGGGSIEDLWAFNSPEVIEAIFQSKIPIATGVGHESDITLADYVSDYRAATPTAAAVYVTPDQDEISQTLRNYKNRYYTLVRNKLLNQKQQYQTLIQQSDLRNPMEYIERRSQKLDYLQTRIVQRTDSLDTIQKELIKYEMRFSQSLLRSKQTNQHHINELTNRSILATDRHISTAYDHVSNSKDKLIISMNYNLKIREQQQEKIHRIAKHNYRIVQSLLNLKKNEFLAIIKAISVQNPAEKMIALFEKGYAHITYNSKTLTSVETIKTDDIIKVDMKDGSLEAKVVGKEIYDKNI